MGVGRTAIVAGVALTFGVLLASSAFLAATAQGWELSRAGLGLACLGAAAALMFVVLQLQAYDLSRAQARAQLDALAHPTGTGPRSEGGADPGYCVRAYAVVADLGAAAALTRRLGPPPSTGDTLRLSCASGRSASQEGVTYLRPQWLVLLATPQAQMLSTSVQDGGLKYAMLAGATFRVTAVPRDQHGLPGRLAFSVAPAYEVAPGTASGCTYVALPPVASDADGAVRALGAGAGRLQLQAWAFGWG
jgi:hypothetical protein